MFSFLRQHRTASLATLAGLLVVAGAVVVALVVFRPGGTSVVAPADRIGCVYSSAESGHKLVRTIQPGESIRIAKSDRLVLLPTGDQIYNMTTSASRTPEAPSQVLAFTKGQTAVYVEGVLKFRFNATGNKACAFYSKYGDGSYGDLGFVVQNAGTKKQTAVQQGSGWYRFLAAAHGDTMRQVVHDGSSAWTWQQLAYGSDPTLKTTPSTEPVSVGYGRHIGAMFTKYLDLNLGDRYFCGVQPGLSGSGETGCPPLYFQILSVYPRDKELATEHDLLKRLDAELARQRQAAKLKAQNRATAIASARAQRKVLEAQIVNTRLSARNDVKIQKCLILAPLGLDCDGKRPEIVVGSLPSLGK